jgi:hypothetical protein
MVKGTSYKGLLTDDNKYIVQSSKLNAGLILIFIFGLGISFYITLLNNFRLHEIVDKIKFDFDILVFIIAIVHIIAIVFIVKNGIILLFGDVIIFDGNDKKVYKNQKFLLTFKDIEEIEFDGCDGPEDQSYSVKILTKQLLIYKIRHSSNKDNMLDLGKEISKFTKVKFKNEMKK